MSGSLRAAKKLSPKRTAFDRSTITLSRFIIIIIIIIINLLLLKLGDGPLKSLKCRLVAGCRDDQTRH